MEIVILGIMLPFFIGFIAGTLAGSEQVRFLIFGKIIWKTLLRRNLIFAKPVCCKNYLCKDGLVSIHGLKLKSRIPLTYISDCMVNLDKSLASWILHWQAHYDGRLSKERPLGKTDHYEGSVNELTDEYAKRIDKYARYPRSKIPLPRRTGRIIEVLAEIHRWKGKGGAETCLKKIVEEEKGEYHLMIAEPDAQGVPHLTPVTVQEGWKGVIRVYSDEFGLLALIEVGIPESPEKYVDWATNQEIPEEEKQNRGQPVRIAIYKIH